MDRDQIKSQRIVERYLSGELLMREAREFERFCFTHPEVLQSLAIPARIKERLLRGVSATEPTAPAEVPTASRAAATNTRPVVNEDSEDEQQPRPKVDRSKLLTAGLAIAVLTCGWLLWQSNAQQKQMKTLRATIKSMSIHAPAKLQLVRLTPSDARPAQPQYSVALSEPQLLDLRIDTTGTQFTSFEVTLDKVDEARIVQIRRVASDSNHELRLALNSTAFGAGEYELRLLGYDWRGNTTPVGWIVLSMR